MGFKSIDLKLRPNYSEDELQDALKRASGLDKFTWQIEHKSLDARNRKRIHWNLRVGVHADDLPDEAPVVEQLTIPFKKRNQQVVVVGNGPAGFFAGYVLQKAGFHVTILERGSDVDIRGKAIRNFEQGGNFDPQNNYAFGEGGAGTFSDGKLTSRSKHISREKQFILSTYIEAGAPPEIAYLAHPHLGTDNLRKIVKNLRHMFEAEGGQILFDTLVEDLSIQNGRVTAVKTNRSELPCDMVFFAPGHSAYETYRMLIAKGIAFRTKNFALGARMEHPQHVINKIQWGHPSLPGVKAAEYRITSSADGKHQVFSFCMCPGGMVVPAAAYPQQNIVNGMSYYKRNGTFANAACVAAIHPDELAGKTVDPNEALALVEQLEHTFYSFSNSYKAPACSIPDFIRERISSPLTETSYPLGIQHAALWNLLPSPVVNSMQIALKDFSRRMPGFDKGLLLGLESKTSAPIQVLRDKAGRCEGFQNLYLIGEGSGYAGGIISSAADGVKAAMGVAATG